MTYTKSHSIAELWQIDYIILGIETVSLNSVDVLIVYVFIILSQVPADDEFSLQDGDEDLAKALYTIQEQAVDAQIMVNMLFFKICDYIDSYDFTVINVICM